MATEPAAPAPAKGTTYGGPCNRTACQRPGAVFWNASTRAYYCAGCARKINEHAPGLCDAAQVPTEMIRAPFAGCDHPAADRHPGPRSPLRWGSAPTEVCGRCGGHRLMDRWASGWRPGPVDTREDDDDE